MTYSSDRQWGDRFIPHAKSILGPFLLEESSLEQDTKQATDLVVLHTLTRGIGVRIRKSSYYADFRNEFTIRSERDSGAETEMSKIIKGWGDWLLYGFCNKSEDQIEYWRIVNLSTFRAAAVQHKSGEIKLKFGKIPNNDGTHFTYFDVRSFPAAPPLMIASNIPTETA